MDYIYSMMSWFTFFSSVYVYSITFYQKVCHRSYLWIEKMGSVLSQMCIYWGYPEVRVKNSLWMFAFASSLHYHRTIRWADSASSHPMLSLAIDDKASIWMCVHAGWRVSLSVQSQQMHGQKVWRDVHRCRERLHERRRVRCSERSLLPSCAACLWWERQRERRNRERKGLGVGWRREN